MISALILAVAFVLVSFTIMGGSGLIVRGIEHGKTTRTIETEKTKRIAFDAAYTAEQNRQLELSIKAADLQLPAPPAPDPTKLEWELPQ